MLLYLSGAPGPGLGPLFGEWSFMICRSFAKSLSGLSKCLQDGERLHDHKTMPEWRLEVLTGEFLYMYIYRCAAGYPSPKWRRLPRGRLPHPKTAATISRPATPPQYGCGAEKLGDAMRAWFFWIKFQMGWPFAGGAFSITNDHKVGNRECPPPPGRRCCFFSRRVY